ncbi:GNAT family N-acetyltransferase [Motilibacter deserti]|uniref:GNAT family N-acetyltransferase n=1 Tax=Motilibacter deserti TaxID=2714956 RepID=UPI0038B3A6FA
MRDELLAVWVDVVNAGGAVGFIAPVRPDDVAPVLDAALAQVAAGSSRLVLVRRGGAVGGFCFLLTPAAPHMRHWATVARLMVAPQEQGTGCGRALLEGAHDVARRLGLEALRLSARGGLGLEGFYERLGYVEIGRFPKAIRVAPGDDRDEVFFHIPL